MRAEDLLTLDAAGLYCPPGGFHVDPVRPVARAVITHGHSDHARSGHQAVLATPETLAIMAVRYGADFTRARQPVDYGETVRVGDVDVTLYPAGHVLGSAQILLEWKGLRLVVSGDYKRQPDPTCTPFEPVRCHAFITEATFALPVFRHPSAAGEIARLMDSHRLFPERTHLVGAYALGKAQRVIALIREAGYDAPILIHGGLDKLCRFYGEMGVNLGPLEGVAGRAKADVAGRIVLCPPSATADLWARRFADPVTAFASGWMRVRARARQRGAELPLVISDHSDWDDLLATIRETGAEEVWVTHGQEDALVHWCGQNAIRGRPLHLIGYGDEEEGEGATAAVEGS
ncbi:ligase-associated DNA damage response exonuclease [Chthonobacter rhizosphaerae]|uniref:ligase-associated DNA damage response exonuclease n=1 Tax=Chthonobacter rhizosphaerae TaxID=2735553 RepID=UPI0015EE75EF|nr:ligase-associated DNA damage response exonuclease [Chthonobacter rhizosphaerae]